MSHITVPVSVSHYRWYYFSPRLWPWRWICPFPQKRLHPRHWDHHPSNIHRLAFLRTKKLDTGHLSFYFLWYKTFCFISWVHHLLKLLFFALMYLFILPCLKENLVECITLWAILIINEIIAFPRKQLPHMGSSLNPLERGPPIAHYLLRHFPFQFATTTSCPASMTHSCYLFL